MSSKLSFLKQELYALSWSASVQHNKIYKDKVPGNERSVLKKRMFERLEEFIIKYKNPLDEKTHVNNINRISEISEEEGGRILIGKKFNIGTSQKLLNLYLKYLWCIGEISEPPHCPIDRIILNKIGNKKINWTQIDDLSQYIEIIEKLRMKSNGDSIAVWELKMYQKIR